MNTKTKKARVQAALRSPRTYVAFAVVGLLVALSACGGASPAATTTATNSTTPTGTGQGTGTPPGAFGTIAAISPPSMEVQDPATGQVTVKWIGSTTFTQTVAATASDVVTGVCVTVTPVQGSSTAATAPVTANTVSVTQPTNGSCTSGFGGGGNGGGVRPSGSPRPRPSGTNQGARPVTGKVSSVSGSTVIEQQFSQATGTTTARTVTLTSSTTYTKIVKGTSTELAVGLCTTALGTADSTGAITARTISVRPVGANGCSAGFGQGGFRGTGGGTNG